VSEAELVLEEGPQFIHPHVNLEGGVAEFVCGSMDVAALESSAEEEDGRFE
jgi:hypothetical protein